jgi:hypothetical protein
LNNPKESSVAAEVLLFDSWFDAIEDGVRGRVRGFIEAMLVNWTHAAEPSEAGSFRRQGGRSLAMGSLGSPETPPAQPRPKTGTRSTSARNPNRPATLASRLGVAIPVDEIVTIVST